MHLACSPKCPYPGGAMAAPLVRPLLAQLFSALAALQALGCTHRDVKPDNVMVHGLDTPQTARLTLIDFGYACCATRGLRGLAGSPEYAAPEVSKLASKHGGKLSTQASRFPHHPVPRLPCHSPCGVRRRRTRSRRVSASLSTAGCRWWARRSTSSRRMAAVTALRSKGRRTRQPRPR